MNQSEVEAHNRRVRWGALLNRGEVKSPPSPSDATTPSQTPKKALLSTDEAKLNKTERAFLAHLRNCYHEWIGIQAMTLKLADDCRYTPDFEHFGGHQLIFYEVKGFWRDDARVKIKVAARMFVWARFVAVQRIKGEWKFEEIKP
jgi:hypothetical protein